MVKLRHCEEMVVRLYPEQKMKTPVHLYIGQEAIATGVCCCLQPGDYVFSTHRGHGVYIAKGGDLKRLTAELYGSIEGCSRGKGGSMHIVDKNCGVCGTTAIVGGNIPLAVGAALASSIRNSGEVACAFFGDGAVDQGVFYESLNFASLRKLPVVFICENNFYATHSHQSKRQALDNIFERGTCFGVPGERVDGNDVLAVFSSAQRAIRRARALKGPTLIECRTYRWKSHVGPQSDEDLGFPPKEHLHKWLKKCPIKRFRKWLIKNGVISEKGDRELIKGIDAEIEEAFDFAQQCRMPDGDMLCEHIYA
jgi:acetoin:2,6-dichlorophenolindophenol oxidoreductase subunit alpha